MRRVASTHAFRRRRGEPRRGRWLAFLLLVLAAVAPRALAQNNGVVSGRVTNTQGQPLSVMVHLLAEGDVPAGDAYSDSNGNFVFPGLNSGTYALVVEVEGYKPFRSTARLDNLIQPRAQVSVLLEPAAGVPAGKGPTVTGTKSTSQVYAKRPAPAFDPKAVKEFDKGNKEQQRGNAAAAIEHYQRALEIDENFFPALNNLGTVLARQGKQAEAQAAFRRALEINPNDGQAYINLGHLLYDQGEFGAAVERLNQGLQRTPESAAANFLLGSAYFKLHDPDKAEPLLKRACALEPKGMAPAHLQLANLYLQRHDYAAAKAELENYLRINPSDPQAPAIKKTIANLPRQ
jgi:Tfp pilus assembly protein PilF